MNINTLNIRKFLSDSSRSGRAYRNILILFIFHSFTLLFQMLQVPLSLRCLSSSEYGTWLTVSSITTWFVSLDLGLGNGLRNKLSEALALNDRKTAKVYISSAYFMISAIVVLFYAVFLVVNNWLNWFKILNIPSDLAPQIDPLIIFVFTFFFAQFILKLIVYIVLADQKPAVNGFFSMLINLLTVAVLYFLSKGNGSSLLEVGIISSSIPMIVFLAASVFLFFFYYRDLVPSYRFVKAEYARNLVHLGFQFFIIQVSSLIVFASHNIIITQLYTPDDVTVYNVAYKYFSIIPLVFGVILTPFWSAYTEAYTKNEFGWMKSNLKKLIAIWSIFTLGIVFLLLISDRVYQVWTESKVQVPFILSGFMGIFAVISMWNNIFAFFVNGTGKIRLQLYLSVIGSIINIPLSIFLAADLGLGVTGIIAGTSMVLLISSFLIPVQCYKILKQNTTGIWNK